MRNLFWGFSHVLKKKVVSLIVDGAVNLPICQNNKVKTRSALASHAVAFLLIKGTRAENSLALYLS